MREQLLQQQQARAHWQHCAQHCLLPCCRGCRLLRLPRRVPAWPCQSVAQRCHLQAGCQRRHPLMEQRMTTSRLRCACGAACGGAAPTAATAHASQAAAPSACEQHSAATHTSSLQQCSRATSSRQHSWVKAPQLSNSTACTPMVRLLAHIIGCKHPGSCRSLLQAHVKASLLVEANAVRMIASRRATTEDGRGMLLSPVSGCQGDVCRPACPHLLHSMLRLLSG